MFILDLWCFFFLLIIYYCFFFLHSFNSKIASWAFSYMFVVLERSLIELVYACYSYLLFVIFETKQKEKNKEKKNNKNIILGFFFWFWSETCFKFVIASILFLFFRLDSMCMCNICIYFFVIFSKKQWKIKV